MTHRFGDPLFFRLPFLRETIWYIGPRISGRYRLSLLLRTESVSPNMILFGSITDVLATGYKPTRSIAVQIICGVYRP